jgi:uncharacterized protein with HEPN domain
VPPRDHRLRLQDMRDLRNLLIHEYFGVSVAIIWETIARDLRPVRETIRRDLERL